MTVTDARFYPGDAATIDYTVAVKGVLTDPDSASVTVENPDGSVVVYRWPASETDAPLVKTVGVSGTFVAVHPLQKAGTYYVRGEAVGTADDATEGSFTVYDSRFV